MPTTLHAPTVDQDLVQGQPTGAGWAWLWLAATPLAVVVGVVFAVVVFIAAGSDWTNADQASDLTYWLATAAAAVPILGVPALALGQGLRAARRGSPSGVVAAVLGGVLIVALGTWLVV